jgi:hypothetical protein
MDLTVKNIDDLRSQIAWLKSVEKQQGMAIRQRFNGPVSVISTILSLFPKAQEGEEKKGGGSFAPDIVQLLSGFLLPFTLNKTIFRRSNFIVKALVKLISKKASRFINESSVGHFWDKIKIFIPGNTKKGTEAVSLSPEGKL